MQRMVAAVAMGCLAVSAVLLGGCSGDSGDAALPTFTASKTTASTTTTTVSQQQAVEGAIRRYEDVVQGMFGNDPFDEARLAAVTEDPWRSFIRKGIVFNEKQGTVSTGPYRVDVSEIVVKGDAATATVCGDSSHRKVTEHGKVLAARLGTQGIELSGVSLRRTGGTWRVHDMKLRRTGSC